MNEFVNEIVDMVFEAFRQHSSPTVDMGDAHGAKGQGGMIVWQSSHGFIRAGIARAIEAEAYSRAIEAYSLTGELQNLSESDRASTMLMDVAAYFAATLAKADPRAWDHLLVYAPGDKLTAAANAAIDDKLTAAANAAIERLSADSVAAMDFYEAPT